MFPCHRLRPEAKAPLTIHGFKDASLDWKHIEEWDKQYPGCAWGTPTCAERGVLDIDPSNGGNESLARLIAGYGPLPHTPRGRTGGGGFQDYLCYPPGTASGVVAKGIDRKAIGGYVILSPSKIAIPEHQGRVYNWEVKPWEASIAEAPAWLLGVKQKASAVSAADPWVVGVRPMMIW